MYNSVTRISSKMLALKTWQIKENADKCTKIRILASVNTKKSNCSTALLLKILIFN